MVTTAHGPLNCGVVACGSHLPLSGEGHRGDFKVAKHERRDEGRTGRCNRQVGGRILQLLLRLQCEGDEVHEGKNGI